MAIGIQTSWLRIALTIQSLLRYQVSYVATIRKVSFQLCEPLPARIRYIDRRW